MGPHGELTALVADRGGDWFPIIPTSKVSIPPGGSLFFDSTWEDTGYRQFLFFGGPAERKIVLAYAVGQQTMTRYEIRHWLDDRSSEPRIEKAQIDLDWHGLYISPSPTSYLPLSDWQSDEEEEWLGMVGFYCKTCDDKIFYFGGHYEDELKQPEFVCSVKPGLQVHVLAGCLDLLYISAENELRVSRRTVDKSGTVRHEISCLHHPSNYFMTELDKLVAPGPLHGYIPPAVEEIAVRNNQDHHIDGRAL